MLSELLHKRHNQALQGALSCGDSERLRKAIAKGADINAPVPGKDGADQQSPLRYAISAEQPECLAVLLEAGALLPDHEADQGQLLSQAILADNQSLALLTTLLRSKLNPDAGSAFFSCLEVSDNNRRLLLLTRLIEFGGDINVVDSEGLSPLDYLIMEENTELVGALIGAGARSSRDIDALSCSEEIRGFVRRKLQDIETRRLLQGG